MQETWVQSLGQENALEKGMATTPVFLPEESHKQRSLEGYSPWGRKESDMTERLTTHTALEKYDLMKQVIPSSSQNFQVNAQ